MWEYPGKINIPYSWVTFAVYSGIVYLPMQLNPSLLFMNPAGHSHLKLPGVFLQRPPWHIPLCFVHSLMSENVKFLLWLIKHLFIFVFFLNPIKTNASSLNPLETSESFSNVFKGYRIGKLARDWLLTSSYYANSTKC